MSKIARCYARHTIEQKEIDKDKGIIITIAASLRSSQ